MFANGEHVIGLLVAEWVTVVLLQGASVGLSGSLRLYPGEKSHLTDLKLPIDGVD